MMKVAIDVFIAVYLLFAWFYDRPPPRTLLEELLFKMARRILHFLTFEHDWRMFAQGTVTHTQTALIMVSRRDGTTFEVDSPDRFEFVRWKLAVAAHPDLVKEHLRSVLDRLDETAVEARFVLRQRALPPWPVETFGRIDLAALGEPEDLVVGVVRRGEGGL
jgi:hypothetical protein